MSEGLWVGGSCLHVWTRVKCGRWLLGSALALGMQCLETGKDSGEVLSDTKHNLPSVCVAIFLLKKSLWTEVL